MEVDSDEDHPKEQTKLQVVKSIPNSRETSTTSIIVFNGETMDGVREPDPESPAEAFQSHRSTSLTVPDVGGLGQHNHYGSRDLINGTTATIETGSKTQQKTVEKPELQFS